VYDEQPEVEFTFDGNDPVEREIYQIFLNIWENWEAFLRYWETKPLSVRPEGQRERQEVPRGRKAARAGKHVYVGLL
jgi:hypothetical protein